MLQKQPMLRLQKNICCVKSEDTVDQDTVIRKIKKFHLGCKNLEDQAKFCRTKTVGSRAVFQNIVSNLAHSSQIVSNELSIS